tara:strand:+ start:1455 stop:2540 length:1086 start_codon:yes stop_codon:yes gene_type:complete
MDKLKLKKINDFSKIKLDKKIKISDNKFFKNLQMNFIKYYKYYDKNIKDIILNRSEKVSNDNSYFIGNDIKEKINKLKSEFIITYKNINIHFITNKNDRLIKKYIINKLKIILSLQKLFNRENAFQKITIYDINNKKKLPSKNEKDICPAHCNSGYCNVIYDKSKNGSIVLYRNEEIIKVLIHESIHANFIDYNIILNQYKSNMDNKICTHYNILLNEAFTETFACLINMILINYHTKININKIFNNELKFMLNTFNKLMNYYKVEQIKDIMVVDGCSRYIKQKTNVFSYYILKTLNYLYIDEYLKLVNNNSNSDYNVNNNNYNKIYIKFVFHKINNLNFYIQKEKIKNRSLRLSLYELNL